MYGLRKYENHLLLYFHVFIQSRLHIHDKPGNTNGNPPEYTGGGSRRYEYEEEEISDLLSNPQVSQRKVKDFFSKFIYVDRLRKTDSAIEQSKYREAITERHVFRHKTAGKLTEAV